MRTPVLTASTSPVDWFDMTAPNDPKHQPIELKGLADLLDVAAAIESADEQRFRRVREKQNPESFWTSVAQTSGFATFTSRTEGRVLHSHSVLWLLPVISLPGFASSVNRAPLPDLASQLQSWLCEWFGRHHRTGIFNMVVGVESFAAQTPVGVRRLLEMLARQRAVEPVPHVKAEREFAEPPSLPRLGFIVGAASREDHYPRIPGLDRKGRAELQLAVAAAMTYWAGNYDAACGEDHLVGVPAGVGEGMQHGLRMWARACKRAGRLDGWDLITQGADSLKLQTWWVDQSRGESDDASPARFPTSSSELTIKQWQLGDGGFQNLYADLTEEIGDPQDIPGLHRKVGCAS